ncbi:MAG: hypothetical protein AAGB24_12870 [Bacteroidota bacterium]
MAVLKKIRASTLMETLVATVLIVVVFMGASMVLNQLFASSMHFNDNLIRQELLQLQYQHEHGQLQLPYHTELGQWTVTVSEMEEKWALQTYFEATHQSGEKKIVFKK